MCQVHASAHWSRVASETRASAVDVAPDGSRRHESMQDGVPCVRLEGAHDGDGRESALVRWSWAAALTCSTHEDSHEQGDAHAGSGYVQVDGRVVGRHLAVEVVGGAVC